MMAVEQQINLINYRGNQSTTFTGRPQGKQARAELDLDRLDRDDDSYEVVIPKGTTSINSSFFLGLFFPSIKKLGLNKFKEKYNIIIEEPNPLMRKQIQRNLSEGERQAYNEVLGETGLV